MTSMPVPPNRVPAERREQYRELLRKLGHDPDELDRMFPLPTDKQPSAPEQQPTPPKK